ncbi:MAG TPA: branched-chain amino acid ABC transporter permease [Ktedonobacterales bacterium]|nr:branched-chain amino acid ABC transporter permease [Ktedonobacterales bacterium]
MAVKPTTTSRHAPSWSENLRSSLERTKIAGRSLMWYISGWRLGLVFLVLVLLFPFYAGTILVNVAIPLGIYVMMAVGLNIVVGYAGLLDLGYVAFFAIGAYVQATGTFGALQVNSTTGKTIPLPILSFWWLLPLGALVAGIFGILLGAPTLRLRGDYLAIVTLGFGEIIPIVFNYAPFWFGNTGISANPPADINLGGFAISFSNPLDRTPFFYLVVGVAVLVILASVSLRDSSLGRAWVAIREDETAAAASGVNLVRTKLLAYGLGAVMGGFAGVLYAAYVQAILPNDFSYYISIFVLAMIVLGGIGSVWGAVVGAIVLEFINVYLLGQMNQFFHGSLHILTGVDFTHANLLIFGLIMLGMILLRPQGLIPNARRKRELKGEGIAADTMSAVGVVEREERDEAVEGQGSEDETVFTGPGADAQGRED